MATMPSSAYPVSVISPAVVQAAMGTPGAQRCAVLTIRSKSSVALTKRNRPTTGCAVAAAIMSWTALSDPSGANPRSGARASPRRVGTVTEALRATSFCNTMTSSQIRRLVVGTVTLQEL